MAKVEYFGDWQDTDLVLYSSVAINMSESKFGAC